MQAVLAIPSLETLQSYGDAAGVLTQKVAGVPLLGRVLATAARASVDSVLVIWPEEISSAIWESCTEPSLLKNMKVETLAWRVDKWKWWRLFERAERARSSAKWRALTERRQVRLARY